MEKAAKAKKRKKVDWEAIERKYSAGVDSLRAIAAEFDVTESLIRYHAKTEKWDRDLSKSVREKTESLLRKAELRSQLRTKNDARNAQKEASQREEVEISATARVMVVLSHRKDIAALRDTARCLKDELDTCEEDLGKRTSILKMLSDTQKNLIASEREAFGLDSNTESSEGAAKKKRIQIEFVDVESRQL